MLVWLYENLGTIIISLVLIAIVALITIKLIKDKQKGKCACGHNCAHCAMCSCCHSNQNMKKKHIQNKAKSTNNI